ncbi:MAG: hypothetical protein ACRDQA_19225 [Nocardioidaceae bacterium]
MTGHPQFTHVAGTMHPYPTYSQAIWQVAVAGVQLRLAHPVTRRLTAALVRARRR